MRDSHSGRATLAPVLACLVGVAALAGPAAVGSAVGAAANHDSLAVEDASVPPGANVTVAVQVGYANLSSYEVRLRYDPSVLTVVSVAGGNDTDPNVTVDADAGWVNLTEADAGEPDRVRRVGRRRR